ncbi:2-aminoethylphosphonate--pyruvate transaminase [Paenibacillus sacheonensis]|uniref:2-aminoethylphosphonate--pyruvate transaminase n=2 Tax=Paenibacillus sacheonensis TaxID=742054 RepID=A0A7X4YLC5_9BACL|nr:2-aminoethylphosphonate--pyruvate transaminase [Paenibacillus sacheonensis]MBM7564172.1 2-aminoethylphosphonate-pyruvate transaminase [Paenibacillus sacheonensis]NBC67499.1 2-aminoethylphosphonate--pyruvate transaminase [Paenibacillus sacheonensis]
MKEASVDRPYLLLTPGPLTTSATVKEAMLRDWCTWDSDYNGLVQSIRERLTALATKRSDEYTTVLMQGSGTFSVEAVIGTVIPRDGRLLVLTNGAYGNRIAQMARIYGIAVSVQDFSETEPVVPERVEQRLSEEPDITHVAVVHCETTTGMLNPIAAIAAAVKDSGRTLIVDAMSSFGGIPLDVADLRIDYLISSANKCIQGVPGFGFVIANRRSLMRCEGQARSLSLDLYDQWATMETGDGKWRFTSPTHVVRAFDQALRELEQEGGIEARCERYKANQELLVNGMQQLGFCALLKKPLQSPFITAFYCPPVASFSFMELYARLKAAGFVIYPGKISAADTFRIGTIGEVYREDIAKLLEIMEELRFW